MAVLVASSRLLLFVFCWLTFYPVSGSLPPISMSDILQNVESHCYVVLLAVENDNLHGYLDEIRISSETVYNGAVRVPLPEHHSHMPGSSPNDNKERPLHLRRPSSPSAVQVKVGKLEGEFRWTKTRQVDVVNLESKEIPKMPPIVIFKKIRKDRSCLLLSHTSTAYPKAEAYVGHFSKGPLLEFINEKCGIYIDVNGQLSKEGLHRQHILANLYSMQSHSVTNITMSDIKSFPKPKPNSHSSKTETSDLRTEGTIFESTANVSPHAESSTVGGDDSNEEMKAYSCSGGWDDCSPDACPVLRDTRTSTTRSSCKYGPLNYGSMHGQAHLDVNQLEEETQTQIGAGSIPRCERVSLSLLTKESFFREYLKRSRPFILADGAAGWPAVSKWTMDYLEQEYGDEQVHIKLAPGGVFEGVEPVTLWEGHKEFIIPEEVRNKLPYPDLVVVRPATQNVKFSEFLQMIRNSSHSSSKPGKEARQSIHTKVSAYLEYSSIPTYFPKLEEDVVEPAVVRGLLTRRHLNIWLSDGNTLGKLHFDPFDNFLCQLKGRKELTLFEPHHNEQLYEAHIPEAILGFEPRTRRFRRHKLMDSTSMVMSPVDLTKPDFQRFPDFAHARPLNCTIEEGDILFMPAFWWHEVQSYPDEVEGRNLAVNFWYEPFLQKEFPCVECKLDVNPFYRHLL